LFAPNAKIASRANDHPRHKSNTCVPLRRYPIENGFRRGCQQEPHRLRPSAAEPIFRPKEQSRQIDGQRKPLHHAILLLFRFSPKSGAYLRAAAADGLYHSMKQEQWQPDWQNFFNGNSVHCHVIHAAA
jgi:hypothetical protein